MARRLEHHLHNLAPNFIVVAAAVLWIIAVILSISHSLSGPSIFYVPELVPILVTSLILLAWGWSAPKIPSMGTKIGYLSIIISLANLLALTLTGNPSNSPSIPGLLLAHYGQYVGAVPSAALYVAYLATILGILGGFALSKSRK